MRVLKKSLSVALAGAMVAGAFIFPAAAAAPDDVVLTGGGVAWDTNTDANYTVTVKGGTEADLEITATAYDTANSTTVAYTDVTWTIAGTTSSTTTGVSIDTAGVITVANNAEEDTYTITATDTASSITFAPVDLVVAREAAEPYSMTVKNSTPDVADSVTATYGIALSEAFTLDVVDQFGDVFDVNGSSDYSYTISGGTTDVTLTVNGNGFDAATTAVAAAGSYDFTIEVVDNTTTTPVLSTPFTVVVDDGVTISGIEIAASPVYGMTWDEIIDLDGATAVTSDTAGTAVDGAFTYTVTDSSSTAVDTADLPNADTYTVAVTFTDTDSTPHTYSRFYTVVVDKGVVTVTFPNNPLNYYYDDTTLTATALETAITGTVQLNGVTTTDITIADYEHNGANYDPTITTDMDALVTALLADMQGTATTGLTAGTYTVDVTVAADASGNYDAVTETLTINVTNKMEVTVERSTTGSNRSKVTFGSVTEVANTTNEFNVALKGTAALSTSTDGDGSTDTYWIGAVFTLAQFDGIVDGVLTTDSVYYSTDGGANWYPAGTSTTDTEFTVWIDLEDDADITKTVLLATNSAGTENVTTVNFDFTAYTSSGSKSSGGSGGTTYKITLNTVGNGKMTSSASSVSRNGNVTLTLTPNSGEELVSLVVNGSDVTSSVTDNGDGTYSYKVTSITAAVTATATFTTNGTVDNTINKFTDISGHWAYSAIKYVYEAGLMNGTGSTAFTPNGITTRAELVTVLWRMAGSPTGNATSNFTDLTDSWSMEAINWAAATGVTTGTSATTFSPKATLTRQEVVTFFYRYAEYQGYTISGSDDLSAYGDNASLASFAEDGMKWAVGNGIITSTSTTSQVLNPLGSCTRGEIATIMQRFCTSSFVTADSSADSADDSATTTDTETETDAEA